MTYRKQFSVNKDIPKKGIQITTKETVPLDMIVYTYFCSSCFHKKRRPFNRLYSKNNLIDCTLYPPREGIWYMMRKNRKKLLNHKDVRKRKLNGFWAMMRTLSWLLFFVWFSVVVCFHFTDYLQDILVSING